MTSGIPARVLVLCAGSACAAPLAAQSALSPDAPPALDQEYTDQIREHTTDPFFLTPYVDHLPASDTVPTPLDVLEHIAGAPDVLTYCGQVLQAASPAGGGGGGTVGGARRGPVLPAFARARGSFGTVACCRVAGSGAAEAGGVHESVKGEQSRAPEVRVSRQAAAVLGTVEVLLRLPPGMITELRGFFPPARPACQGSRENVRSKEVSTCPPHPARRSP